jgi:hypothetical protein
LENVQRVLDICSAMLKGFWGDLEFPNSVGDPLSPL